MKIVRVAARLLLAGVGIAVAGAAHADAIADFYKGKTITMIVGPAPGGDYDLAARLVGISLSAEAGRAAYVPVDHQYPGAPNQLGVARALALLRPWLEDPARKKIGQNLKYDQHVLANHEIGRAHV